MRDVAERLSAMSQERRLFTLRKLPNHLAHSGQVDRLSQIMTNFDFLQAKIGSVKSIDQQPVAMSIGSQPSPPPAAVYEVLEDFQNALTVLPFDHPIRQQIGTLFDTINLHSQSLDRDPTLFVQQMHNALVWHWDETTVLGREMRKAAQSCQRTWLKQRNRPVGAADPALLRTLTAHDNEIRSLSFSVDGKMLASGSKGGSLILWNVEFGQLQRWIVAHRGSVDSIAFSPDGKTLASGGGLYCETVGHSNGTIEVDLR
ncbi:MAG: PD40 domain-containing protein [Anaerolineales bacterium]|nr:PD40 domain-containing protein [Anaerolineales bacterium]